MISGVLLMVAVITGIVCGETPRPSGARRAAFKDAGQAERHLLAALGMKRRPVVDKSKVEIPAAMLELYRLQASSEYDAPGLPLPGRHVKSANTARTYLHRGECPELWQPCVSRWGRGPCTDVRAPRARRLFQLTRTVVTRRG